MGAAKKLSQPSDELWLNERIKEGSAKRDLLSMKALGKLDISLQQRVHRTDENGRPIHLDMLHVSRLERMVREGKDLFEIVVFRDPKTNKLRVADGFHRHEAYRKAGMVSIPAWVIEGTYRDALIYSAMANQVTMLPRKPEDIKKAVFALLSDEEWLAKGDRTIADHVGCSGPTVAKYKTEYRRAHGLPEETTIVDRRGHVKNKPKTDGKPRMTSAPYRSGRTFVASIGGKSTYLGHDEDVARKRLSEIMDEKESRRSTLIPGNLRAYFMRRSLVFREAGLGSEFYGLGGSNVGHGVIWVVANFERSPGGQPSLAVRDAVGHVLLAREQVDPSLRAVVVCYLDDAPPKVIEVAKRPRIGVEFLAPDELVASIKGTNP